MLGAAATSGCSLYLDFDKAGLACDADGQCADGYVCNGSNQCMPAGHSSTLCTPECTSVERCERAQCVPVCDNRACPAGARCENGECKQKPKDFQLGSRCKDDNDCRGGAMVCLRPYGEKADDDKGVCTRPCTADTDCDGEAPICVSFPNGKSSRKICANPAFMPCENESDCTDSGLSCGVFALEATYIGQDVVEPVSACRERLSTGAAIGETCSSAIPCANGLCALVDGKGVETCTSPCDDNADCEAVLGGTRHACTHVTLNPDGLGDLPRVRPKLCSKDGVSIGVPCATGGCHADAPYCLDMGGTQGMRCVTACADGASSCPGGHVCVEQEGSMPDVCLRN